MNYRIISKDGKGICPKCSGLLMRQEPLKMKCFDCGAWFRAIDTALFDAEMIYTEGKDNE